MEEAVHGQFAEVAVKKKMSAFLQQQEERKEKRKGIRYMEYTRISQACMRMWMSSNQALKEQ